MKIYVFTFLSLIIIMQIDFNFEEKLSHPISQFESVRYSADIKDKKRYIIHNIDRYLDKDVRSVSALTDSLGIIEKISIHFSDILDRDSFDKLIDEYEFPDHILKADRKVIKEVYSEADGSKAESGTMQTKETVFEDNPIFILWNKEDFQIKITFNYIRRNSKIEFIKF